MINFNDIKYERPDFESIKNKIEGLITDLINCENKNEYIELVKRLTLTSLTPFKFLTALSTRAEQAAQLIPLIKYFSSCFIN